MKQCLLFISFDDPFRLYRAGKILEKYSGETQFHIYIQPADASRGVLQKISLMTDLEINPLERENFSGFDLFYVDLSSEEIREWGKNFLKKLPFETMTFQFIDKLDVECFVGDILVIPGFFDKMQINRQVHKLVRFGIITGTDELGDGNIHYSGKRGKLHIFIGPAYYRRCESSRDGNIDSAGSVCFVNKLEAGFENDVLKLFPVLIEDENIKKIKVVNTPLMPDKEKKRFSGFLTFLKKSSIKVIEMTTREYYDEVCSMGIYSPSIILSSKEVLPVEVIDSPIYLLDDEFWAEYRRSLYHGIRLCGSGVFDKVGIKEFLDRFIKEKKTLKNNLQDEQSRFSGVTDLIGGVLGD